MARGRRMGVKPPKEKPELKEAPEVLEMAAKLISDIHTHLAEAKIKYLFRTCKWELRGKTIYGRAEKVSSKWRHLTGFDFVVTINRDIWFANKPETREAILDHQLMHCARGEDDKQGNPKWYIQDHDFNDFVSVVRRHGLWTASLQNIVKANEEFEQVSMFPKTGTEA